MGWKGQETSIPLGMIFRKMFCHKCGTQLKKQKVSNIYYKGDNGFQKHILGHRTIGMDKIEKISYIYVCPNCNSSMTYEMQVRISKIQKRLDKKILSDNEQPSEMMK